MYNKAEENKSKIMALSILEWDEKYSVGVELIDSQHKKFFSMINNLVEVINSQPSAEKLKPIIKEITVYKQGHFATEEKFFHEFNYEGTAEHEEAHHRFDKKVAELIEKNGDDAITFAFELVDFLEDWLLDHLMDLDQKYKKCFQEHGLK